MNNLISSSQQDEGFLKDSRSLGGRGLRGLLGTFSAYVCITPQFWHKVQDAFTIGSLVYQRLIYRQYADAEQEILRRLWIFFRLKTPTPP